MVKTWVKRLYMAFIFLLLYLPIIVLVVLSFNKSKARVAWRGFTFQWYANLFDNSRITDAFTTTLTLAFGSALAATIIGVVGAIGISAMKKRNYSIMLGATNIPMLNAEIVTALSLTLLFIRFIKLGFTTVFIGHVTFGVPYVILNVLPRLRTLNKNAYEAALDLGATPLYAFFKVCWPELMPGIMSGFLMAATMSMDEFVITINKCKKMLPEVPMGYLMEARMDNMGFFTEENGVEYYHPDKNFLTEEMVRDCHAHGIGVNVWTVNKKELMEQLNNWNVDGIFTNFPDRAKELGLENKKS